MGRPKGSGLRVGVPDCIDHPGSHVVRDGRYGTPPRQLWRCTPADGSKEHNFAGPTPRFVADESHTCPACERPVAAHEGATTPTRYEYAVREAAAALAGVGNGLTYTEASLVARARSGRNTAALGAQLACNWVEVATPIVAQPHKETIWPETIVCDSTNFLVTDSWTNQRSQAFAVLAVWGYEAGAASGRLVALRASHQSTGADWWDLFSQLKGTPKLIVADRSTAIHNAAARRWPQQSQPPGWSPVACEPFVKWCSHHLYELALAKMKFYRLADVAENVEVLKEAFKSPAGWAAFKAMAEGHISLESWCDDVDPWVTPQVAHRATLPAHDANGAVEKALDVVREVIGNRAFTLRNQYRTNQMLELVRLRINRHGDENEYANLLRQHLAAGGTLGRQLAHRDTGTRRTKNNPNPVPASLR